MVFLHTSFFSKMLRRRAFFGQPQLRDFEIPSKQTLGATSFRHVPQKWQVKIRKIILWLEQQKKTRLRLRPLQIHCKCCQVKTPLYPDVDLYGLDWPRKNFNPIVKFIWSGPVGQKPYRSWSFSERTRFFFKGHWHEILYPCF